MVAEGHEGTAVRWHRMISKVAADHLPQPAPLDGDRLMHTPPQRVLDPPQGRPHAVGTTLPLELEGAPAGPPADVGEPQEAERLRFAEPALGAPVRREAAKRDQAGLVRMQRQRKLLQARAHRVPEALGIGLVLETDHESSSGGDLHPSALSEPDVRLSPHPAPTLQPPAARPAATGQTGWDRGGRCAPASAWPHAPGAGTKALQRYYEPVRPCASHRYSAPQGSAPWRSPLASRRQVPTFRTRASRWSHAVFMPVAARPVGRLPPSFVAGQQREPGFGDVPTLSTRQQRFTHVRLTSAHLTGLLPPFAATLTTSAIGLTQLAVVWTLILQSEPEGPTLISCAARLPGVDRYMTPSSRRRGAPSSA